MYVEVTIPVRVTCQQFHPKCRWGRTFAAPWGEEFIEVLCNSGAGWVPVSVLTGKEFEEIAKL